MTLRFKRDDLVIEGGLSGNQLGIILQSGKVSYDVIWIGGSTSRYRYRVGRLVRLATEGDIAAQGRIYLEGLRRDAAKAQDERRRGAGVRRGQVSPSR